MDIPDLRGPTTDPTELLQLAEGMHAIEVLAAAVGWLDLFEWLADHPADTKTVAAAFGLPNRPTHVMLTLLRSLKLVDRDDCGVYSLTQLAREYLLRESPWSVAPVFAALKDRPACTDMLHVLRTGRPMTFGAADDWASGMGDEMFAEFFLAAIDSRNAYLAHAVARELDLTRSRRLLDVGGGSGIYSCALVRRNPELTATVFEKHPVAAVATRAIARRELSDRVSVLAGDMLAEPLPAGYDVHLYSNVLHDWEEVQAQRLLCSSFRALNPGGRVVVHDALLDDSGAEPVAVAQYSVLLMAVTAGRCYAVSEVRDLLSEAGFAEITHTATVVHRDLVTAVKLA
ncbi:MAG: methyltransferase [Pseudonocardiaceae bacterium]